MSRMIPHVDYLSTINEYSITIHTLPIKKKIKCVESCVT